MNIKARISDRGKAYKFVVVEKIPEANTKIGDTDFSYGECKQVTLPSKQRIKDSVYHKDYDFFIVPVLDESGIYSHDEYFCRPHKSNYYATTLLYQTCLDTSRKFDDRNLFVTTMYNSDIWDTEDVCREGREEWLGQIWDATHRNMKDIIRDMHMSQLKVCRFFGIPRRTLEDWCSGISNPPTYLLIMMQEIFGLVERN